MTGRKLCLKTACCLVVVLISRLSGLSAQAQHEVGPSQLNGPCTTPNMERGTCVELRSCEPLMRIVRNQPVPPLALQFLLRSECSTGDKKSLMRIFCCAHHRKLLDIANPWLGSPPPHSTNHLSSSPSPYSSNKLSSSRPSYSSHQLSNFPSLHSSNQLSSSPSPYSSNQLSSSPPPYTYHQLPSSTSRPYSSKQLSSSPSPYSSDPISSSPPPYTYHQLPSSTSRPYSSKQLSSSPSPYSFNQLSSSPRPYTYHQLSSSPSPYSSDQLSSSSPPPYRYNPWSNYSPTPHTSSHHSTSSPPPFASYHYKSTSPSPFASYHYKSTSPSPFASYHYKSTSPPPYTFYQWSSTSPPWQATSHPARQPIKTSHRVTRYVGDMPTTSPRTVGSELDLLDSMQADAPAVDAPAVVAAEVDVPAVVATVVDAPAEDATVVDEPTVDATEVDSPEVDAHEADVAAIDAHAEDASAGEAAGEGEAFSHPHLHLLPVDTCGPSIAVDADASAAQMKVDDHPWVVLLQYENEVGETRSMCGGVLISTRYVLTAAHCLRAGEDQGYQLVSVLVGEHDTASVTDCEDAAEEGGEWCVEPAVEVAVEREVAHPEYSGQDGNQLHDIALLRLEPHVLTNHGSVTAVCLPLPRHAHDTRVLDNDTLLMAGWGVSATSFGRSVKLQGSTQAIRLRTCASAHASRRLHAASQLCASARHATACVLDSGGALTRVDPAGRVVVAGLASYGADTCGNRAGVFTRVAKYTEWILDQLEP